MKIAWKRNIFDENIYKRNKIIGIEIITGYACNYLECEHRYDCKYVSKEKLGLIKRFIRNHTWIHIRFPITITKKFTNLSGTVTCKFGMNRSNHSCYYCKSYDTKIHCSNELRAEVHRHRIENGDISVLYKDCKYFELNEYFANYDHTTGETIITSE